jgi:hypothetical protein
LFWHFTVYNTAASRHPLNTAVLQETLMACAVTVPHATRNHVRDGFKPAVGMIWKTTTVIIGIIAAKVIEHQEGVESPLVRLRQNAREFDAIAVSSGVAHDLLFDATTVKRHVVWIHGM